MSPRLALATRLAAALLVAAPAVRHAAAQPLVPETRLVPAGASAGDQFGRAVALSGDRAVVAAAPETCANAGAGGAHIFVRTATGWAEEAFLTPPAPVCFWGGAAVAIDGDRALIGWVGDVGAPGRVFVFARTVGGWHHEATLTRPGPPPPPDDWDGFGWTVALDGARALVGSHTRATLFEHTDGAWSAGTALVPDAPGTFGGAVALDGAHALVGGYPDAVVFRETPAGWVQEALLVTDGSRDTSTGVFSVALDGGLAAVGRADQNGARGLVSVFSDAGGAWTREPALSDGGARAFGGSVALDGPDLLVGAYLSNAAFRFERVGGAWVPAGRLTPEPADGGVAAFGVSVALGGGRALVGAYRADGADDPDPSDDTGAAYLFSGFAVAETSAPSLAAASLSTPAPNPTAGRTTLTLRLDAPAPVRALLVDALGRTVAVLFDGVADEETTLMVETAGLPAGVYAVRVSGPTVAEARRLTVVR